jgi:sigma-B regulation protein RsbU (phosphoserine phosphatase)
MLAGDFAGMLTRSDGAVFAWVGDVAGKGPAAAMLMATAQAWLYGAGMHLDPLEVITSRLNEFIFERSEASEFATLFLAVIHTDGRTEVCDAGHGIAFCLSHGAVQRLEVEGGPPLGLVSGTDYSTSIIELSHASRLVLVTDGVHEQRSSQNEQFGFDRMIKLLSTSTTCESDIELLVREVAKFAGPHFDDDVTILSIQRVEQR